MFNFNPKYILTSAVLLLTYIAMNAAPKFTAKCPDKVLAGEAFEYRIRLESNSWQNFSNLQFDAEIELIDYRYEIEEATRDRNSVPTITTIFILKIDCYGHFTLPNLSVTAEGKQLISPLCSLEVVPGENVSEEYSRAIDHLLSNGADKDKVHLRMMDSTKSIILFADPYEKCFAAVTQRDYTKYAGKNGVLAWSVDATLTSLSKNGPQWVFKAYEQQLAALKEGKDKPYFETEEIHISQLLGATQWGQEEPYNSLCPKNNITGKAIATGCIPVAMGQIMMYYKYPSTFDWNKIHESYENEQFAEEDIYPVASLMLAVGTAAGVDYAKNEISTSTQSCRDALVNRFGYSASAFYFTGKSAYDRISMAKKEIKEHRPVIIVSQNHGFISDGINGEYFHYNFGWNGYANGWYRILISENGETAFKGMMADISPDTKSHKKICLTLPKPGLLRSQLTKDEIRYTDSLEIKGYLNNDDIRLLRQMAGGIDEKDNQSIRGRLIYLDLSNARFKEDAKKPLLPHIGKWFYCFEEDITRSKNIRFQSYDSKGLV